MAQASKIATVIVPMADQDAAVDFYVGKLGFEKRVDIPFGPGPDRWIEVGLPGAAHGRSGAPDVLASRPREQRADGGRLVANLAAGGRPG
jgi:catechol 2,3-dioxygenase-like lactoylglutathione lyase family enzyme